MYFYYNFYAHTNILASISPNVPAVTDVFLRPNLNRARRAKVPLLLRKNAKHFYGRKKMWRRRTAQRAFQRPAHARLPFFVALQTYGLMSRRRRSVYRPVRRRFLPHNYNYILN